MTEEDFREINWSDEFYIEFIDGKRQLFASGPGINWDSGINEIDENEGRANISCCLQKKSPSQQRFRLIHVWVDEIRRIEAINGHVLWQKKP